MSAVFTRQRLFAEICELLKRDYVALLGQRGSGIQTFIEMLVNEASPASNMKFISISLPESKSSWSEDSFNEFILDELKAAIADVPEEVILRDEVSRAIEQIAVANPPADYRLRLALNILGRKTAANPLVIVLQSLAQAPEVPLRNLLLLLRDYHKQRNMQGQPGKKLRFLAAGDIRLWLLCRNGIDGNTSPFNIAKRFFLEGLSYKELEALDQFKDINTALCVKYLTDGVPSLVERIYSLQHIPNDFTPFFGLLDKYWNSLPENSKQVLKQFARDAHLPPKFMTDYECPQIPSIESPWIEAFWKGFLRIHNHELAWRSPIHRAFVLDKMQISKKVSKTALMQMDLLERSLRLEKALLDIEDEESGHEQLEEVLLLQVQTPGTILAPLLKMVWNGEDETLIFQALNRIATTSDKVWVKELAEKVTKHHESMIRLFIDAAIWETKHVLGDIDTLLLQDEVSIEPRKSPQTGSLSLVKSLPSSAEKQPDEIMLRHAMMAAYNPAELRLLCSDLKVNYHNLEGEIHEERIKGLIDYMDRRGRYKELVDKVLQDRSHLKNQLRNGVSTDAY